MARARDGRRGFTLVEVMIVVAIVGVLVAIAVPMFGGTTRKAKAGAEVPAMFQDFRTRMDQYHQENGVFPPTIGEGTVHPATPGRQKQTILPLPAAWSGIRLRLSGPTEVYCGYTWATGLPNDAGNIGAVAAAAPPAGFGFTAPATNWYYLLAKCDMDGSGGFSYYFTSSVDPTIQKRNEGD